MAGWVGATSDLLGPLVDVIGKHVFAGRKLHADDTPMPVLAPGNGKTKTGRIAQSSKRLQKHENLRLTAGQPQFEGSHHRI